MLGTVVETAWLLAVVGCTALVIYGGWLVASQWNADARTAMVSPRHEFHPQQETGEVACEAPEDLPQPERDFGISVAIVKSPIAPAVAASSIANSAAAPGAAAASPVDLTQNPIHERTGPAQVAAGGTPRMH